MPTVVVSGPAVDDAGVAAAVEAHLYRLALPGWIVIGPAATGGDRRAAGIVGAHLDVDVARREPGSSALSVVGNVIGSGPSCA